jgi:hypothetical protein
MVQIVTTTPTSLRITSLVINQLMYLCMELPQKRVIFLFPLCLCKDCDNNRDVITLVMILPLICRLMCD